MAQELAAKAREDEERRLRIADASLADQRREWESSAVARVTARFKEDAEAQKRQHTEAVNTLRERQVELEQLSTAQKLEIRRLTAELDAMIGSRDRYARKAQIFFTDFLNRTRWRKLLLFMSAKVFLVRARAAARFRKLHRQVYEVLAAALDGETLSQSPPQKVIPISTSSNTATAASSTTGSSATGATGASAAPGSTSPGKSNRRATSVVPFHEDFGYGLAKHGDPALRAAVAAAGANRPGAGNGSGNGVNNNSASAEGGSNSARNNRNSLNSSVSPSSGPVFSGAGSGVSVSSLGYLVPQSECGAWLERAREILSQEESFAANIRECRKLGISLSTLRDEQQAIMKLADDDALWRHVADAAAVLASEISACRIRESVWRATAATELASAASQQETRALRDRLAAAEAELAKERSRRRQQEASAPSYAQPLHHGRLAHASSNSDLTAKQPQYHHNASTSSATSSSSPAAGAGSGPSSAAKKRSHRHHGSSLPALAAALAGAAASSGRQPPGRSPGHSRSPSWAHQQSLRPLSAVPDAENENSGGGAGRGRGAGEDEDKRHGDRERERSRESSRERERERERSSDRRRHGDSSVDASNSTSGSSSSSGSESNNTASASASATTTAAVPTKPTAEKVLPPQYMALFRAQLRPAAPASGGTTTVASGNASNASLNASSAGTTNNNNTKAASNDSAVKPATSTAKAAPAPTVSTAAADGKKK